MTLILKLDLDIVQMYLYTKNEVSIWSSSKVLAWTDIHIDRQMDRQTDMIENITNPDLRVVTRKPFSQRRVPQVNKFEQVQGRRVPHGHMLHGRQIDTTKNIAFRKLR